MIDGMARLWKLLLQACCRAIVRDAAAKERMAAVGHQVDGDDRASPRKLRSHGSEASRRAMDPGQAAVSGAQP